VYRSLLPGTSRRLGERSIRAFGKCTLEDPWLLLRLRFIASGGVHDEDDGDTCGIMRTEKVNASGGKSWDAETHATDAIGTCPPVATSHKPLPAQTHADLHQIARGW
jgi:hypothetical protein